MRACVRVYGCAWMCLGVLASVGSTSVAPKCCKHMHLLPSVAPKCCKHMHVLPSAASTSIHPHAPKCCSMCTHTYSHTHSLSLSLILTLSLSLSLSHTHTHRRIDQVGKRAQKQGGNRAHNRTGPWVCTEPMPPYHVWSFWTLLGLFRHHIRSLLAHRMSYAGRVPREGGSPRHR